VFISLSACWVLAFPVDVNVTALERAFDLAKSGECRTVRDIRFRLKRDGYAVEQIVGRQLQNQLVALMAAARSN
jgi:hypothetical protein